MKLLSKDKMLDIDKKEETPEVNVFKYNGELIFINQEIINLVLNFFNKRFVLEDFSKFKEKNVIQFFYNKEKSNLEHIELNFKDNEKTCKFFKYFVSEIIEEKYRYNISLRNIRNSIEKKINELIEEINKCKDIYNYNLSENNIKKFNTNYLPKFLEKDILAKIDEIKLINKFNQDLENVNIKKNNRHLINLGDCLTTHYFQLINCKSIPFEGGDKKILFDIFLYSNLKDIYKNPKIKDIFLNNSQFLSTCFVYEEGKLEISKVINKRIKIGLIIDKLIHSFNKYEIINEFHPFILASFFYLVMNKMKSNNNIKNNLYNPLMIKIIKNVLNCFFMYCPNNYYNDETYIFLFNYFTKIIAQNENTKNNKKYEFEDIKEKINKSQNAEFISELKLLEEEIKKRLTVFQKKEKSFIKLIPLTKKRKSHTITILISGFLSQHDSIETWKHFYDYDKENTTFYMLKWPSSDILTFIFKILSNLFHPKSSFNSCYEIAQYVGGILALFLLNNDDFNDCIINLVGFSLGCQVITNCLKELNKYKNKKFMINDVLLMGGATVIDDYDKDKWRNIFINNVGGKIVNCFSEYDDILSTLFKNCIRKTPIGSKRIDIKDENGDYLIVDDYNCSEFKLGHLDYRQNFGIILKTINFFN